MLDEMRAMRWVLRFMAPPHLAGSQGIGLPLFLECSRRTVLSTFFDVALVLKGAEFRGAMATLYRMMNARRPATARQRVVITLPSGSGSQQQDQ